ncbi:MAG: iron-containing alcohol dehydrogenase [Clostridiales Family XIII bacterium]|nr:iron-containing alcohol dehydrogenase [Clostridiales Family XIII bacterium]
MKNFIFKMPTRVHFGSGIVSNLSELVKEYGGTKVFIISDPVIASTPIMDAVKAGLGDIPYIVYSDTKPDPTIEMVDEGTAALKATDCDLVVSVGGGSPIDLAKGITILQTNEGSARDYMFGGSKTVTNKSVPHIAIPTTAGTGSEVTGATVITDVQNNIKLSITHDYVIPTVALVDPQLHLGMPTLITASTGLDALTHAIESYVSLNASPVSDAMGLQAIRLIGANLRTAVADGSNIEARSSMAVASTIASVAFMNGGLGVIHGIAQSMGGLHHTPHGIANGLLLPYAMHRNYIGNLKKFREIAIALGEDVSGLSEREGAYRAVEAVFDLQSDVRVPNTLPDVEVFEKDFGPIIEGTMAYRMLAINPVKLTDKDVRGILDHASAGR